MNVTSYHKKSIRLDITGWERWFIGNYARKRNLTILPEGICTNQNPSWEHKWWEFSGILSYKQITKIPTRRPDRVIVIKKKKKKKKKKRTCLIEDFAIPSDHRVKSKENKKTKKKGKYLVISREQKKLWNKKVSVITIVIGSLGTIHKALVKGLQEFQIWEQAETIQTTELLRSARILRRVLETWESLLSFRI